jgi:hypothetical protein
VVKETSERSSDRGCQRRLTDERAIIITERSRPEPVVTLFMMDSMPKLREIG